MSKAVMISIRPRWCELIASGKKTIELRKTAPKLGAPFKCYIYCTKPKELWDLSYYVFCGKVIGEFVCDRVFPINVFSNGTIQDYMFNDLKASCVPYDDIVFYIGKGRRGVGWHISDLVIYDEPKVLQEFRARNYGEVWSTPYRLERPPQSWCYVDGLIEKDGDGNA